MRSRSSRGRQKNVVGPKAGACCAAGTTGTVSDTKEQSSWASVGIFLPLACKAASEVGVTLDGISTRNEVSKGLRMFICRYCGRVSAELWIEWDRERRRLGQQLQRGSLGQ